MKSLRFLILVVALLEGRKRTLTRLKLRERFERELVVVVRRHRKLPDHLARFVENVLFQL